MSRFVLLLVAFISDPTITQVPVPPSVTEYVAQQLKDPDSAKFRNLEAFDGEQGRVVVCGEVNAKNSFGGYTGFQLFFVAYRNGQPFHFGINDNFSPDRPEYLCPKLEQASHPHTDASHPGD